MKQSIILLHGLFGGLSNWTDVVNWFEKDFEIHVPILPLYDEHNEHTLDYLVGSLKKLINDAALKDVILVGNSLGGHVAILYAHRYPTDVSKLVLTGSSGLYENYIIGSFPRRHDRKYIRERVAHTFHNPQTATEELVNEVFDILADNRKCFRIIKTAKVTQREYVTHLLLDITIPVMLIWGNDDRITPPAVAEEFKRLLPNAQLAYLNQCGHAPMMEKPTEFNELLARFVYP